VIFLNLAVIFGLRYHLYIALVWILGLVFGVILLASLQSLHRVTKDWVETWLPSLGLAVAVTQLGWVMQFWPLHYVVQAGVAVVAYYVVFNLLSISFERKLSRADMIEYGAVGGLGLIILLFTANWF
jgi:hypothetical protein